MKRSHILKPRAGADLTAIDPDNPPWTEEMLGPPIFRQGRGPYQSLTKLLKTLRLDPAVIEYFRAQGPGYQTRINEALRGVIRRDTDRSAGRRVAKGTRQGIAQSTDKRAGHSPGRSTGKGVAKKASATVAKVARKAAEKKLPNRSARRR